MKWLVKKLDCYVQGEGSEFQFFLFLVPLCNQTSALDLVITVLITRSCAKWATHCNLNISIYRGYFAVQDDKSCWFTFLFCNDHNQVMGNNICQKTKQKIVQNVRWRLCCLWEELRICKASLAQKETLQHGGLVIGDWEQNMEKRGVGWRRELIFVVTSYLEAVNLHPMTKNLFMLLSMSDFREPTFECTALQGIFISCLVCIQ